MLKNLSLRKKSNPYEFKSKQKNSQNKHKRAITEDIIPGFEIDSSQFQLQKVENQLKSTLKSNTKQYKQLIKNKLFHQNSEVTASVDNIHIVNENKTTRAKRQKSQIPAQNFKNNSRKPQAYNK